VVRRVSREIGHDVAVEVEVAWRIFWIEGVRAMERQRSSRPAMSNAVGGGFKRLLLGVGDEDTFGEKWTFLLLLAERFEAVVLPTLEAGVDVVENMESRRALVVVDFFELLVLGVMRIAESEDCRTTF
jgi:hypothetical protein